MRLLLGRSRYLSLENASWLRPLLVVLPLLLSALVATRASSRQLMFLGIAVLAVCAVGVFLRWPALGPLAASVAGIVVPFRGPSGLNVTMMLVALLVGLWLLTMMARQREIRLVSSRAMWPLLAFVVVSLLSFGIGQLPWFTFASYAPMGAQLGGLSLALLSAAGFVLVANQVRNLKWLSRMTWGFLAVAALSFVFRSVLPELGLPTRGLFQSVGSQFYVWLVAVAFSQATVNRDLRPGWRLALGGLVLICLYHLVFMKFADKSGWIPALASVAAIIGLRSRRAGLILVLGGIVVVLYLMPRVFASDEYSVATRFDAWLIMAEIIKVSPIWGMGFANYYWYTPLFPIRGYAVSFNSHNNYVDIVAQTGLLGLVCFLWFMYEVGRLGWWLRERAPAGFARAYVYGAMGGLAGTAVAGMLGDWVLPFFYNIGLTGFRNSALAWIFLGGLVTIEQAVKREKRLA